jgi:hypothetical protein
VLGSLAGRTVALLCWMSGRQKGPNKEMNQPRARTMEMFGSSICADTAQDEMRALLLCMIQNVHKLTRLF